MALKDQLYDAVESAYKSGCRNFSCGMARGCDLFFAEAVIALRAVYPDISLDAWLPCPSQASCWQRADRSRYEAVLKQCSRVLVLEDSYSAGCMLRRNRAMLDQADRLISVYAGSGGGTGQAVSYAKQRGILIDALWL